MRGGPPRIAGEVHIRFGFKRAPPPKTQKHKDLDDDDDDDDIVLDYVPQIVCPAAGPFVPPFLPTAVR